MSTTDSNGHGTPPAPPAPGIPQITITEVPRRSRFRGRAAAAPVAQTPAPVEVPPAPIDVPTAGAAAAAPATAAPVTAVPVVSEGRGSLALPARIASWVVMGVVSLLVVGLLSVTIGPRIFHYQALVVRSGSMAPTIPTGSIVFYTKIDAANVKKGDVIVFSRPDNPSERVTHRVYSVGRSSTGRYFITKGDANGAPDDWRVPAVGTGWLARFHIPTVGYVLYDLQSTAARLLLLVIPAILLGLITVGELWRDRQRRDPAT